jgi:Zn-dependent protease with chaperone function
MTRITLHDIDAAAWIHPRDSAALSTFRAIPGADKLIDWGLSGDHKVPLEALGDVTPLPPVSPEYDLYVDVLHTLDAGAHWPIFVHPSTTPNAIALGGEHPHLVISKGLLDTGDPAFIRFALGHEVGHLLADHCRYRYMMSRLILAGWAGSLLSPLVGAAAVLGLKTALGAWSRASEYSSDRAGLLALQHIDDAKKCLERLRHPSADGLLETLGGLFSSHPEREARIHTLLQWAHSGEYVQILSGEYARRSFAHNRVVSREDYDAYLVGVKELSTSAYDVHDTPEDRADWHQKAQDELSALGLDDDDDDDVDLDALINDELDDL